MTLKAKGKEGKKDLQKEKNENYVINEHLYKRLDKLIDVLCGIKSSIPRGGKDITDDWKEFQRQAREHDEKVNEALERQQRERIEDDYKEQSINISKRSLNWSIIALVVSLWIALIEILKAII